MNFDNLVEDAEKHGANLYRDPNGDIVIAVDELQALITQYILADRAQGQEPVGDIRHWNKGGSGEFAELIPIKGDLLDIPHGTKLFTRAQPTPAQIAEIQAQALELILIDIAPDNKWLFNKTKEKIAKLRKGEPL